VSPDDGLGWFERYTSAATAVAALADLGSRQILTF
jgi:hypothetical protein